MKHRIQTAFDQVQASDALKAQTKQAIYRKTNGYGQEKARVSRLAAGFLVLLLAISGYFSYTIPVAAISMDINPSIELEVNLYDRVITAQGYNDAGTAVVEELNLNNMAYLDAINAILANEQMLAYLNRDNLLEITVVSGSEKKNATMEQCISSETEIASEHIHCSDNREEIDQAHAAGLSCGKYRVFLQLQELYPELTPEDVQDLSMKELQKMLGQEYLNNQSHDQEGNGNSNGHGHGQGHDNHVGNE